jgi:hypothetical protein
MREQFLIGECVGDGKDVHLHAPCVSHGFLPSSGRPL